MISKDISGRGGLTKTGRPYYVFDNVYESRTVDDLLLEQDLIIKNILRKDGTGGAKDYEGKLLKNNFACFINDIYKDYMASPAFRASRSYFTEEILFGDMSKFHWALNVLRYVDLVEQVQFLYYENSNSYGCHEDKSSLTLLYWLAKEPMGFEGGDLILDNDVTVDFKSNRLVAMSCRCPHEVTKIVSLTDKEGYGRHCISTFLNFNPYT